MIYGIKDCANLTITSKKDGNPFLHTDYANVATNEWTSERVYANAKGTRSIGWDYDKQSTLTLETELFDLKFLAMLAGSAIETGEADILKREIVQVNAGKTATLKAVPVTGSVAVIAVGTDLLEHIGEPLEEVVSAPTGAQYSVTGSEVAFATDAVEGTVYAVYYVTKVADAKKLTFSADKFPEMFEITADALIRERETGRDDFVQIQYHKAQPQGNFTITMSATEPTNLSITFDLYPNAEKAIADYTIVAG
nr:MAG TPA: structural protein [Caudoviricetes sp.]